MNDPRIDTELQRLIADDSLLDLYRDAIRRRLEKIAETRSRLTSDRMSLPDFASGHEYFGLHFRENQWIFREWAPNATHIFLIGQMTDWLEKPSFRLERISNDGVWELRIPAQRICHKDLYRLKVYWPGGRGDRIPAYARRVVQDPNTLIFNAQVWAPDSYPWRCLNFKPPEGPLLIYEAHVGMAQDAERIGSFDEFSGKIIPRIVAAGYNTLQLMAVPEHPYYGSFGYHVSNFFAASSRFGTPEELKNLVDTAHEAGLRVIMDVIHSHAVSNEVEGLSRFDGTSYQYFHEGPKGRHLAWDSRCFDYGKHQVLHFLLSNCRFWLDEYRFDGFRFDGVTSMLYWHHGLEKAFTSYADYFDSGVDEDALTYLALANEVIHTVKPDAVTVAEDISGMPGLAASRDRGGIGFDYRFAMGVPDLWIRLIKHVADENWPMGGLWYELNNRRPEEKTVSYAESHDQALVGDQTLIFRLIGSDIYEYMHVRHKSLRIDRGIALHKLIRFITLTTAGSGYLNFMGNEFGHPEWIDFPRPGNNWSYRYARRQWRLADAEDLKYRFLGQFDRDMIELVKARRILESPWPRLLKEHDLDKVIAFERAGVIFVFNFHPTRSHVDYPVPAAPGKYRLIFDSDRPAYGGHDRLVPDQCHFTLNGTDPACFLSLYIPTRTVLALCREA